MVPTVDLRSGMVPDQALFCSRLRQEVQNLDSLYSLGFRVSSALTENLASSGGYSKESS